MSSSTRRRSVIAAAFSASVRVGSVRTSEILCSTNSRGDWPSGRLRRANSARRSAISPGSDGIGAPSSLAVTLAEQSGMTLVGFLRDDRCNVYAHAQRLETVV